MATPKGGYWLDGKRLPSVTTILSRYKDSGALMKWGYREGRSHGRIELGNQCVGIAREMWPVCSDQEAAGEILEAMLGKDWLDRELEYVPYDLYDKRGTTANAALAGTIAHDMIELYVLSKGEKSPALCEAEALLMNGAGTANDPGTDVIQRAKNSFTQFLEWYENTRITVTHTEMGLMSKVHKFGGTPDAIGTDSKGRVVLIDWKTSNAVYGDYLYQLAAYALLIEENHPELKPEGFHLLRVAKESADFAHHFFGELDQEKRAFILMRELYEIDARTKKRA